MNKQKWYAIAAIIFMLTNSLFIPQTATGSQPIPSPCVSSGEFTSTLDFDNGTKVNTTSSSDRYNITADQLELDFPYAEKDANLTSYWRFENNTDDETGNHSLTWRGVDNATGKFGNCFEFVEANEDYLSAGDDDNLSFGDGVDDVAFSISTWLYLDVADDCGLVAKYNGSNVGSEYAFYMYNGAIRFLLWSGSNPLYYRGRVYSTPLATGTWYHLVATYDGRGGTNADDGIDLYVNGSASPVDDSSDNNGPFLAVTNTNRDFRVGGNMGIAGWYLDGKMDEVKLYDRELSSSDVQTLYNNGNQYVTSGYWESPVIIMPDGNLTSISLGVDNAWATGAYIDRVDVLYNSNDTVFSSYTTDITANGTKVLYTGDFDNGLEIGYSSKINVTLAGGGSNTPHLLNVSYSTVDETATSIEIYVSQQDGSVDDPDTWGEDDAPNGDDSIYVLHNVSLTDHESIGNATIWDNGQLNLSIYDLTLSGDFVHASNGTFNSDTGKVIMAGTGEQTISGGPQFYDLDINNNGEVFSIVMDGNLNVSNNLNMIDGHLNLSDNNAIANISGNITISNGADISYGSGMFYLNGTTTYTDNSASPIDFGNITVFGTTSIGSDAKFNNLTIGENGLFGGGNGYYDIEIVEGWNSTASGADWEAGNCDVVFTSASSLFAVGAGSDPFYNLTIETGATTTVYTGGTVSNYLTVNGTFLLDDPDPLSGDIFYLGYGTGNTDFISIGPSGDISNVSLYVSQPDTDYNMPGGEYYYIHFFSNGNYNVTIQGDIVLTSFIILAPSIQNVTPCLDMNDYNLTAGGITVGKSDDDFKPAYMKFGNGTIDIGEAPSPSGISANQPGSYMLYEGSTIYLNGSLDSYESNNTDWDGGDSTLILDGSGSYEVDILDSDQFNNLHFNKTGGTITLNNTIERTLAVNDLSILSTTPGFNLSINDVGLNITGNISIVSSATIDSGPFPWNLTGTSNQSISLNSAIINGMNITNTAGNILVQDAGTISKMLLNPGVKLNLSENFTATQFYSNGTAANNIYINSSNFQIERYIYNDDILLRNVENTALNNVSIVPPNGIVGSQWTAKGTVTGNYTQTYSSNDSYQILRESLGGCPEVIFYEGFENGTLSANWSTAAWDYQNSPAFTLNSWEIGAPSGTGSPSAYAGSNVAGVNVNGDYNDSEGSYLETPVITLSESIDSPTFSFWMWMDTEANWDGMNMKISVDAGAFTNISTSLPYDSGSISASTDNPIAGESVWKSDISTWTNVSIDLTPYMGSTIQFRWHWGSDTSNTNWGLAIDEVMITTYQQDKLMLWGMDNNNTVNYSKWNYASSIWGENETAGNYSQEVNHIRVATLPNANQMIIATISDHGGSGDLHTNIWYGENDTWGTPTLHVNSSNRWGDVRYRHFDIQKERITEDVLYMYTKKDNGTFFYKIWNGTAWGSESNYSLAGSAQINYIWAESDPYTNEISVILLDADSDVYGVIWNGSAFGNEQLLTSTSSYSIRNLVSVQYEQQSGDAMFIYSNSTSDDTHSRIWDGTAWESEMTAVVTNTNPESSYSTADPKSDRITVATKDSGGGLFTAEWNGTAWSSTTTHDTLINDGYTPQAVIYETTTGREGYVLLVYGDEGSSDFTYRIWNGSAWGSYSNQTDNTTDKPASIELDRGCCGTIYMMYVPDDQSLQAWTWNGTAWTFHRELDDDVSDWTYVNDPFEIALIENNCTSQLEHIWNISVSSAYKNTFYIEANRTDEGEGDSFTFYYSTTGTGTVGGTGWTEMLTITKTTDDDTNQSYTSTEFANLTGKIYIGVIDDNRRNMNTDLDVLTIDHMYIQTMTNYGPEISSLAASPSSVEYGSNVNVSCSISDIDTVNSAFLNITYPDSSYTNNSMGNSGSNYWRNTTYSQVGMHTATVWANDSFNVFNSSTVYFNVTDIVQITFISQTPANIRWNASGNFIVQFNITTKSTPINQSSILFAWAIYDILNNDYNHSYVSPLNDNEPSEVRAYQRNEDMWFEQFNSTGTGEIGEIGEWGVFDNLTSNIQIVESGSNYTLVNMTLDDIEEIYGVMYLVDYVRLKEENKTGQTHSIYGKRSVETFFNMTGNNFVPNTFNESIFDIRFYAQPVGSPSPLEVFVCNSSYVNGNPRTDPNCVEVGEIFDTTAYDHSELNSSYYAIEFTTNETGYVGDVLLTANFSLIFSGGLNINNRWELFYADDNVSESGRFYDFNQSETTTTTTNYNSWSETNGTIDCHIHFFKSNEYFQLNYKVYAADTSDNGAWSSTEQDLLDEANLAPLQPIVTFPNATENYTIGDTVNITYIWLGDPNHDTCWLNITAKNSTTGVIGAYIQNRSIAYAEYGGNTTYYYDWDTTGQSQLSSHIINITATDPSGLFTYSIQNGTFNLQDNTLPEIANATATPNPQQRDNGFINITVNVTDDIGIFGVWLNITQGNGTIQNFSMSQGALNEWYYNWGFGTANDGVMGLNNYTILVNDTSNNWNSSTGHNFTIIDTIPPCFDAIYYNTVGNWWNATQYPAQGAFINISGNWSNGDFSTAFLNISYPNGSFSNTSMNLVGITFGYLNQSYSTIGNHTAHIYIADTNNNINSSGNRWFIINDTTAPTISNITATPSSAVEGSTINITCNITDNVAVDNVTVNITGVGNFTMSSTGSTYYYAAPYATAATYNFTIWANDTSNNSVNGTGNFTITVAPSDGEDRSGGSGPFRNSTREAKFEYKVLRKESGQYVVLFVYVGDDATSWRWSFGDGKGSQKENPTNRYAEHGTYTVICEAKPGLGLPFTYTMDIVIPPPLVDTRGDSINVGPVSFAATIMMLTGAIGIYLCSNGNNPITTKLRISDDLATSLFILWFLLGFGLLTGFIDGAIEDIFG